jgi:hypothetical protein
LRNPREVGLKGATYPSQGCCESRCQPGLFGMPMQITGYL